MENKEIKNTAAELNDEVLDNVSGGTASESTRDFTQYMQDANVHVQHCTQTIASIGPLVKDELGIVQVQLE